nr:DUF1376 domain-containing protein [Tianweitania aestuarii]
MKTYIGTETSKTIDLTAEEFGAYERLRRYYWEHQGLPDDDRRLMRITGVDADRWEAVRSAICWLFAEGWRLPDLDAERGAAAEKRERAVIRSQKAAEARWKSGRGNARSNATSNAKSIPTSNATSMRSGMPQAMLEQCPSASASDEERYEERLSSTRTRDVNEYPFDPPESVEQGRSFLERKGVQPEDMDAKLMKLMAFRLYPSELPKRVARQDGSEELEVHPHPRARTGDDLP